MTAEVFRFSENHKKQFYDSGAYVAPSASGVSRFGVLSNPRSGSTLLSSLLRCHPAVVMHGELLDEVKLQDNEELLAEIDRQMHSKVGVEGFKLMVDQLVDRKISPLMLIRRLNLSTLIVLYRRNALEEYVSLQIAIQTNKWYSEKNPQAVVQESVDEAAFVKHFEMTRRGWEMVMKSLAGVVPMVFVEYDELCKNEWHSSLIPLQKALGLEPYEHVYTRMKKQNPASIDQKIKNYGQLSDATKTAVFDVEAIYKEALESNKLNPDPWWPSPEPSPNTGVS